MNADGVASYIAPLVNVNSLAGQILQFGKESFASADLRRSPGAAFKRVDVGYTTRSFALHQEAIGWSVTEEQDKIAQTASSKLDLRRLAVVNAAARMMQSWEVQVAAEVQNPANYEASNVISVAAADQFNKATSDPEILFDTLHTVITNQVGIKANRLLLSEKDYLSLKRNKRLREFMARGTAMTPELLATIFDVEEVRVSRRRVLNTVTGALEPMYSNSILFYQPTAIEAGFMPATDADMGRPAAFYSYMLNGGVASTEERFDADIRSFKGELMTYRSICPVGLGTSGLVGAAALILNGSN